MKTCILVTKKSDGIKSYGREYRVAKLPKDYKRDEVDTPIDFTPFNISRITRKLDCAIKVATCIAENDPECSKNILLIDKYDFDFSDLI